MGTMIHLQQQVANVCVRIHLQGAMYTMTHLQQQGARTTQISKHTKTMQCGSLNMTLHFRASQDLTWLT